MPMERKTVGWREWVRLPDLEDAVVKAKVDTGARTSSLHAYAIAEVERDGESWVSFRFHPNQRDEETEASGLARLVDRRVVTPSSGHRELRYVVETDAIVDGERFPIELTLTRRDAMGFRMLLGRRALRGRFTVDPKRSFRTAESREIRTRVERERAPR
jgi:hypothetical protein